MSDRKRLFVFGYGSLVDGNAARDPEIEHESGHYCHLDGYRRCWTVAMDNSIDLPGYKYFVDPSTGERPRVYVTFLNIERDPTGRVNGIAFPISDAALVELEQRERNYRRGDVTAALREDIEGQVYAFAGLHAARARFATGKREGRTVVSKQYYDGVLDAFRRLGEAALKEFKRFTDEPGCPIVPLRRIDLP